MIDYIVRFVGCVNLLTFFAADFFYAYVLHRLKEDHPAIDDCAPGITEVDSIAILSQLQRGVGGVGGREELGLARGAAGAADAEFAIPNDRQLIIHRLVIAASFSAPLFAAIQIVSPSSISWSMFTVPNWLGYLCTIPGLGACMFYASRAARVSHFIEVSKSQWLSMMWFRLDMMCVMATVLLLGWGDWLVAACLFVVALYLAHRLLVTEKRLSSEMKATQLIREEINLETLGPRGGSGSVNGGHFDAPSGYDAITKR